MAEERSRRPAGTGATADHNSKDEEGYRSGQSKARAAPWFKLWSSTWSAMAARLNANERGALISLFVEMHESGRPVPEDLRRLARLCGVATKTISGIIDTLEEERCVVRTERGIWSSYMQKEIEMRAEKSELARKISHERWKKNNENNDPTMQMHTEMLEDRGKREEGLQPSSLTSTSNVGESDSRARTSRPARVGIGDIITVDGDEYELEEKRGANFVARRQTDRRPRLMDRAFHPIRWMEDEDWSE